MAEIVSHINDFHLCRFHTYNSSGVAHRKWKFSTDSSRRWFRSSSNEEKSPQPNQGKRSLKITSTSLFDPTGLGVTVASRETLLKIDNNYFDIK